MASPAQPSLPDRSPRSHTIRILHISDLHEGTPGREHGWRKRRVLGEAWEKNIDEIRASGRPVDLVCFTGDIAFSGKAEQYARATDSVKSLLGRLKLPIERFFTIPGNHDVDQDLNKPGWKKLRSKLEPEFAERISVWLSGGEAPPGVAASDVTASKRLRAVLDRTAEFRRWLTAIDRTELLPDQSPHGRLGFRQEIRLPGLPFPIQIIGLDTAWLCGDDNDTGKLWLTEGQIASLASDKGEPLPGFRIALYHHPLTDLRDCTAGRRLLADWVDIGLRGHLHDVDATTWSDPIRTLRELGAGCLYDSDRYHNGCQVIDLTLDDAGRPLKYELWFRSWSPRGHWFNDDGLYMGTKEGRLVVHISPQSPGSNPIVSVGVFVGREPELARLESALLPRNGDVHPVAVCGMPGVGKSYLAERFASLHHARFPGGVVRVVLAPQDGRDAAGIAAELRDRLQVHGAGEAWDALLARLRVPATLVVIENVDDDRLGAAVRELVQDLPGCAVLVTGRLDDLGHAGGWCIIPVKPLTAAEALEQLSEQIGERAAQLDAASLRRFVSDLGFLPLAIHIAAGYLRGGYSPQAFLEHFHAKGLALGPPDPADPRMADKVRAVLAESLDLSVETLRRTLEEREGLPAEGVERLIAGLCALGHAPLAGFGRSLGRAIADLAEADYELVTLHARRLSLLDPLPPGGRRTPADRLHPLLAEHLRSRADARAALDRITAWFVARLPKGPPGEENAQGRAWGEVQEEWAAMVDWLTRVPPEGAALVVRAGILFAITVGPFLAWAALCDRGLARTTDPAEESDFLWTLGQTSLRGGDLPRAEYAARRKSLVDGQRGAAREAALAAGMLSDVLAERGELDEALRIRQEEELPVYERLGEARDRAAAQGQIASLLAARGELDEALRILRAEVLPVVERLGDVRESAVAQARIADILADRGELDEALRIWRVEVLPVFERLGDVRARAVMLGKIAEVLATRGELDEALRIWRAEVLPVVERLGDVHSMLVGRAIVARHLLARGRAEDRPEAARLLALSREAAERLQIHEARTIRKCQEHYGF